MIDENEPAASGLHDVRNYHRMMERVKNNFDAPTHTITLHDAVAQAQTEAVRKGELTATDAERIGSYVERDLHDVGSYLTEADNEFADWLRFDWRLIEERILELFAAAADRTRLELLALQQQAQRATVYRQGEIIGLGSLQCTTCGRLAHFHHPAIIPACVHCNGDQFQRPAS